MRVSLPVLLIFITSCGSNQAESIKKTMINYGLADSILQKSKESLIEVSKISVKSDSVITVKVDKTVNKIQTLNHEVKVLKKENRELRSRLNTGDDGRFKLLPIDKSSTDQPADDPTFPIESGE
jgi:hypothetical protein